MIIRISCILFAARFDVPPDFMAIGAHAAAS